ncbi:MAG: 2-hydroxychromene-2-carboxylate isomerase [Deltaproteobacteria bacterium]|nr:2-hydroxychromene-2-carboxylate isomerase [Deltaproteobacteria bacterium]
MAIHFYFDFVSPYAFVAWTQIHAIAERNSRTLEVVPVLFAGLLERHGQKGPAEIPAKRVYTYKDALRKAARAGIHDFRMPPAHPFNPLTALRVAHLYSRVPPAADPQVSSRVPPAADPHVSSRDVQRRVIDALYRAAWREGAAIDTPEAVASALDRAGLDGAALVAAAATQEIKDRLRRATDDAIACGVFGVPTARVDDEIFWGSESLTLLEDFLRGEDPLPRDHGLDRVPVGADRKGHLAAAQQRKPVE